MTTITRDSLKGCKLRLSMHADGRGFFADYHTCVEHPRLTRVTRYEKKTRSAAVSWHVDGLAFDSLEAAAAALNAPAILSDEQRATLDKISKDWEDLRKTLPFDVLHTLTQKGQIEWKDGKCRRIKSLDPPADGDA